MVAKQPVVSHGLLVLKVCSYNKHSEFPTLNISLKNKSSRKNQKIKFLKIKI